MFEICMFWMAVSYTVILFTLLPALLKAEAGQVAAWLRLSVHPSVMNVVLKFKVLYLIFLKI